MGPIKKYLAKRKNTAELKQLHKLIVKDSLNSLNPKTDLPTIDIYRSKKINGVTFLFYPIQLNRSAKYIQYIRASISDDNKVTTPLSWDTIKFIKDPFSTDIVDMHQITLNHFNSGQTNLPFEKCYSTAFLGWDA